MRGTRNGTSGARIKKFQKTDPPKLAPKTLGKTPWEPKSDSMAGEFNMVTDIQTFEPIELSGTAIKTNTITDGNLTSILITKT